jgi:hypothetical protein
MSIATVITSSRSEPIVTTIEELEPIKRGTKLDILPIKHVEVPVVVVSSHVKTLEDLSLQNPYH